jgi:CubicO group peptidase (beta-lactamase class C family)
MTDPRKVLPRTVKVIEQGIADRTHVGAQVYVSLQGKPVADFGLGEARPGVPMTADSLMIWWSSTKTPTAVAVAQQWERGKFDLDDKVCQYIPEFGTKGKDAVTIRHVLTHTGGFRFADRLAEGEPGMGRGTWDEIITRICSASLEPGWVPGKKAGYHPTAGWYILGELVRRLDGRPFARYVREEIFEPLGMLDCWIGMPPDRYRAYGDRIGIMHNTAGPTPQPLPNADSEMAAAQCVPGAGGRGPMRELGRFNEMLLFRGQLDGVRILRPQTVEAITARHRVGMFDETFQTVVDWGLGFIIDGFIYGRYCSPRTFGHGGAQSSQSFVDPEYGLVINVVCNGMPGGPRFYARSNAIAAAIYEDLALVEPGSPGRELNLPAGGLT